MCAFFLGSWPCGDIPSVRSPRQGHRGSVAELDPELGPPRSQPLGLDTNLSFCHTCVSCHSHAVGRGPCPWSPLHEAVVACTGSCSLFCCVVLEAHPCPHPCSPPPPSSLMLIPLVHLIPSAFFVSFPTTSSPVSCSPVHSR